MAGSGAAGTDEGEVALPAVVAAAWGVRERSHKGPKPALSAPRIAAAAVRVADAEGLDAVSMGRVAAELGAAPMSLYRHVGSKDDLLALMVDAAYGDLPEPSAAGEGWRAGLTRCARALRDGVRAHPWAVRIPISGLPVMPYEVTWFERVLECLRDTRLSETRKASVVMLVAGYVRNIAITEADVAAAVRRSGLGMGEWMASYAAMLRRLADPQRFPALADFIAAGVFDDADDPDDEFVFGLERILDGIEVLIDRQAADPS